MGRKLLVTALLLGALGLAGQSGYLLVKARLAQWLLAFAWDQQLADGRLHRPWPWADTYPIARLTFPERNLRLLVLAGASGRNLAFAPAHLSASVTPGQVGVSVIGGHRDTHFDFLARLRPGEPLLLQTADGRMRHFAVAASQITDIRQSTIRLQAEAPVLALVACYPFDALTAGGPLRYLVIARSTEPPLGAGTAL
ncbi:MAG: class GN sortase [Pseudomonadota bacterium]|nr:class GN sortase [Pseudomonadales bacterium]MDY6919048.1 class GN sortase [Pseudomonadota bacterium]